MNAYVELKRLMHENPELVFNNDGYQNLSHETVERNKNAISEIESILKKTVKGFVRFQNFKPRKDGSFAVRMQTRWDETFTGVTYIPLSDFKAESTQ